MEVVRQRQELFICPTCRRWKCRLLSTNPLWTVFSGPKRDRHLRGPAETCAYRPGDLRRPDSVSRDGWRRRTTNGHRCSLFREYRQTRQCHRSAQARHEHDGRLGLSRHEMCWRSRMKRSDPSTERKFVTSHTMKTSSAAWSKLDRIRPKWSKFSTVCRKAKWSLSILLPQPQFMWNNL